MSAHAGDDERIARTHNTARFFTETRQISWVLLLGTLLWGVFAYRAMPQRKDPEIPVRVALAICAWPGASAERIEQLVTRKMEEKIAENSKIKRITSNTRTGIAVVTIQLTDDAEDTARELDDIGGRLAALRGLPEGAGPINFVKDFGDTAALLLTIASPPIGRVEIDLRAAAVRSALAAVRAGLAPGAGPDRDQRVAIVYGFPRSISPDVIRPPFALFSRFAEEQGALRDVRPFSGSGFVGLDAVSPLTDAQLLALGQRFIHERLRASEIHPDAWQPVTIRDPRQIEERLAEVAGDKYSYRELQDVTDLVRRTLQTVPQVAKVTRSGLLEERIYLSYSQEQLASYGLRPQALPDLLKARNSAAPGGVMEVGEKTLRIDPAGELRSEKEIGDVLVPVAGGASTYLRDLVQIARAYDSPPRYLAFYSWRDAQGAWHRSRAVTVAVQMRAGQQIAALGSAVDRALGDLAPRLPEDLIVARTSDQPLQVHENIDLFMRSLYEAIALVVLVSLVGFWEWRSALLMALAIPLTLALTFGFMHLLGIDLQQVSIASLILALGLLVDDPVVAGDAIKRDLALGHPPLVAAWLGPTKLATAILYATITNIVAYLPLLLLSGDRGRFLHSLPIVIAWSLVASRLVSMTFIPFLGYYILRPHAEPTVEERRQRGFAARYYRLGLTAIRHRVPVLLGALGVLVLGFVLLARLGTQFFPKDLSYLSYVEVWLPDDAPLAATATAAATAERVIEEVCADYGRTHPGEGPGSERGKEPRRVLDSLTTFLGGGGPRFWFSVSPEQSQLNYAQIVVKVADKHDTQHLVEPLQRALSARVPGANVDVRQLESGPPVGIPVSFRLSGEDEPTLRGFAAELAAILRREPRAIRVRDDWGAKSFVVRLDVDADRANLSGISNYDVAVASAVGMNGLSVGTLREGDQQIPIVARLRMEERARVEDLASLYVYASQGPQKVPLGSLARLAYGLETPKIQRRNQFRTITVAAFPAEGVLPSDLLKRVLPGVRALEARLPPGYRLEIGGEYEEQVSGFAELGLVMAVSVGMIFLALVVQFRHAAKPLIVFAAVPFGVVGAVVALWLMGAPFGFMAFLGVASLVGVIVSHIIVLFDFIEEKREEGEPLEQALLDAGIMRLRPVLITVAATVIALFPLASHGGPLWEPLCYAQIGGLVAATFITLLLVPVLYSFFVLDLKWVRWEGVKAAAADA